MNRHIRRTDRCVPLIAGLMWVFVFGSVSTAADKAKIQEAILRGQRFLIQQRFSGHTASIAALGYIKSGGDKKHEAVQQVIEVIRAKVQGGTYRPLQHHNYEAGIDIMLLEAVDIEANRPQMEAIVAYLLGTQQPNGAWFYDHKQEPDCGDTSITQYALLGLWAASRAGIEVPVEVWEKAARWHISKQRDDGGFCYQPFEHKLAPNPEDMKTTGTMSGAGSSNLLIIRRVLFDDADQDPEVRPTETKRRFGVLERFVDERPGFKPTVKGVPTIRPGLIDKALKDSVKWTGAHFAEKNFNNDRWFAYYFYCIERVAALMDVEKIGTHDWYDEGAEELLKRQAADGSWNDACTTMASTPLALLFLSKATTTVIAPKKKVVTLGGGLQAGGRGLPDNLNAVEMKDGNVAARKMVGPVDNLLIELERSADAKVQDIQTAVVDAVQLDRPEDLIGQVGRLRKLAVDSRVEVRRTALWALGRSGEISAAKLLIEGLSDPDINVIREASLGLCILARRPEGCGKPIDPTEDAQLGLTDVSTDDERKAKLTEWQNESKKRWRDWYQKYRPYDERDDRSALKPVFK